jgi:RHS repeat-associated protein
MSHSYRSRLLVIVGCFVVVASTPLVGQDFVKTTTIARSTGGHEVFKEPQAIAVDLPSGALFIADSGHHQIVRIDPSGARTIVAGSGTPGRADGTASVAQFRDPHGIAIDSVRRVLYVADTGNHLIRRVTMNGVVSTVAGSGRPEDLDGVGANASFKQPSGLALDAAGNLYVADRGNDKIRVVTPGGTVTTLAGRGRPGYGNGAATQALFKGPRGIAVSPLGEVFVADTQNHVIRKVANGIVSTVAGTNHAGNVDGSSVVAEFNEPSGIALDTLGVLWVADTKNHSIRRVAADGVTTVAGDGHPGFSDASDVLHAEFHEPSSVVAAGAIFIADSKNDAVRMLVPKLSATSLVPQSGSPNGGDTVRILGSGFIPGRTSVTFGGASAVNVVYVSPADLLAVTPPGPIGDAEVRVNTIAGSAVLPTPFHYIAPFVSITIDPATASLNVGSTVQLTAFGVATGTTTDITSSALWSSSNPSVATVNASGLVRAVAAGSATITAAFRSLSRTAAISVLQQESLPPDPASVATAFDPTVVSDMSKSVQFLYTGSNLIQKNVPAGAIDPRRIAVIRGRIRTDDGSPLSGVRVSILGRPFFGFTTSRADGMFDLAINGGGDVVVVFEKSGWITAQRRVNTPLHDYVVLEDVYLTGYDANATVVQMGAAAMQIAQGTLVSDSDGSRRATLFIPAGTTSTIETATGSQTATSLTIRATEFSVGPNGPKLMPAALPPTSAYTYCVELSTDEAVAANARNVTFSTPLPFYVDNFLDLPVGTVVPTGYYDRIKGSWIASDNGLVIKILSTQGGTATIDTNGDGIADDASDLGVTSDELQKLAGTYESGQSLWRTLITHFTPWDLNFPYVPPAGADAPHQPQPTWFRRAENPQTRCGSTIDCHNQVFGEAIPIDGTPFALQYQSDHAPGYKAGNGVDIPLSGSSLPAPLKRIDVEIRVQGRLITQSFPVAPNQTFRFTWDGHDGYGRPLQGLQIARIRVGYVYDGVYATPPEMKRAFAAVSGIPIGTNPNMRQELTFWQDAQALVGSLGDLPLGFGGWTLNAVKILEPASGIVHGGAAGMRTGDLQRSMIDLFAGGGTSFGTGDGGFARDATFRLAWAVAAAPDGTVYISDYTAQTIRRVDRSGLISTVVPSAGHVEAMAVGPDEALYYAVGTQIRRWDPLTFTSTLFAGSAEPSTSFDVDEIAALDATLGSVDALAFGPDGSLYLSGLRIRRIGADGIIYGVTGPTTLPREEHPEGRSAILTNVGRIGGMTVGPGGTVYFTVDANTGLVFAIPPSGVIQRFAGTGTIDFDDYTGDGGPALEADLNYPATLAAAPDGSLYLGDLNYSTIRRVLPNGIVKTVAGSPFQFDAIGDGGPAASSSITNVSRMAIGADGALYVTDQFYMTTRRISPPDPLALTGEHRVPSADGASVDIFSSDGRHLRTVDAVTGVVVQQLGYDANKQLVTIADAHGNVTRIERTPEGIAAAIVSPFGKRTTLTMGSDRYLKTVESPGSERTEMTYVAGQITTMKNPRGVEKTIAYDTEGRLLREEFPDGSGTTLTREGSERDSRITVRSGEGLAVTHDRQIDDVAQDSRVDRDPATGLKTITVHTDDGASTTTLPDATIVSDGVTGDPRFKTMAPLRFGSIRTPAGRSLSVQTEREVTLSNRLDPLSLRSITETFQVNGRPWKSTFTKSNRVLTSLTPMGRSSTATLNALGDVVSAQVPGLAPTSFTYDPQGRVTAVQMGARTFGVVYNSLGEVERVTDPLTRSVSFEYDAAGRVKRQILPDTRSIDFTYDENGNLTSVSPPARPAHAFTFTLRDQVERYTPPAATPGGVTQYLYNRDQQLTRVTRPDGSFLTPGYDAAGRLATFSTPDGSYTYDYAATTGKLVSVTAPHGETLTYTYDGPLPTRVNWSGTVTGSIAYDYDADLRVSNVDGATYAYDDDNLLIGAGALVLRRNAQNGFLTGSTLGLVTDDYTYNEFGEAVRYAVRIDAANLLTIDYSRDAAGRIMSKTETIGATARPVEGYEYDRAGRLVRVTRGGTVVAEYDYDANSNRAAHRLLGTSSSATYDAQDRLLTYDDTAYTYSANGELRTSTTVGVTTTFDYDAMGNLRNVRTPGREIEYVIDGQNRRIGKRVDGVLAQAWLYADQLRVVAELDGTGTVISRFVYGSRSNAPDFMIKNGVTYRIVTDHLGSPRLIVNAADGVIAQELTFDEFGQILADTNPGFQPFGYAGGLYDRDTGFVRFGARDYDARTGRWTAKEPLGFNGGDSNLYVYVGNDPVNWVDPSGLTKLRDMECSELRDEINRLTNELRERVSEEQAIQRQLVQGILARTYAQAIYKYWQHRGQYQGKQKRLNRLMGEYDGRPCDPPLPQAAYKWAERNFPSQDYIWESYRASLKDFLLHGPPRPRGPVLVPPLAPMPIPVIP